MLQSYNNPIMSKTNVTKKLANIRAKETNGGILDLNVVWINDEIVREIEITTSISGYSLEEVEKVRQDFKENFKNLRKYPRMTEKDWE